MFQLNVLNVKEVVDETNKTLSRLSVDIRNRMLKQATKAAGEVQKNAVEIFISPYRGSKEPTRKIRGTNIYIARPRLADSIKMKLWRSPSGDYMAIAGPVAIEVPHGHWFESGTGERYTKAGEYRGVMFSNKGGPPHVFSRAFNASSDSAVNAFITQLNQGIASFQG